MNKDTSLQGCLDIKALVHIENVQIKRRQARHYPGHTEQLLDTHRLHAGYIWTTRIHHRRVYKANNINNSHNDL